MHVSRKPGCIQITTELFNANVNRSFSILILTISRFRHGVSLTPPASNTPLHFLLGQISGQSTNPKLTATTNGCLLITQKGHSMAQHPIYSPEPNSWVCTVSWKMITAGPRVDKGTSRPQRAVVALSSLVKCFR